MNFRLARGGLVTVLVAGAAMLTTTGCASSGFPHQAATEAARARTTLVRVRNDNWQDVKIYLVREAGGPPVRLGTVTGLSTGVLRIREPVDGRATRLLVEPIGSRAGYVTNVVFVNSGSELSLFVHNSLSLSTLNVRPR